MDDRHYCVYMHRNKINNKVYIGLTGRELDERCGKDGYRYLHKNKNGDYNQPAFANAILKYGWENFEHIILCNNLTEQEAKDKEIELIALYKSNNKKYGYNISIGGEGNGGRKLTEQQKENISKSRKGVAAGKECFWYGKTIDDDSIKKRTESFKKNYKKENHHQYGKKQTQKQEESNKVTMQIIKEKLRKPVAQIDKNTKEVVNTYDGVREASRITGFDCSSISKCCRGERKTAYGFIWEYIEKVDKVIDRGVLDFPILQIDPKTLKIINNFSSIKNASDSTGVSYSNIYGALDNSNRTAGGFKWERYIKEKDAE